MQEKKERVPQKKKLVPDCVRVGFLWSPSNLSTLSLSHLSLDGCSVFSQTWDGLQNFSEYTQNLDCPPDPPHLSAWVQKAG